MNRLAREKAAYLRHSAEQNIDWHPWSEEAFEQARKEDKPVFLSSGAIWCHWCHVMAKECFYHEEIVDLLNEHFISIKLDRDERPDVDRRYQKAVAAMGQSGGWPLNVFLTPDKRPFFGGTYFPPEDSRGRPGFKTVLRTLAGLYKANKDDILHYTGQILDSLKAAHPAEGEISEGMVDKATKDMLAVFDPQNGGFGAAPKFPMPGAMEFLMNRYFLTGNESPGYAAGKTLEAMAKGGLHDQLGGGFHRYSVDEAWIMPHFEKMADDSAWLLRNYVQAYRMFGNAHFRGVAEGILAFARNVLSAAEGGFYASQDADVTPDDEGGYFTWTEDDFRRVLDDEEYKVLEAHLFHDRGAMHHDPSKRVLFIAADEEEVAARTGIGPKRVHELIRRGKKKLLHERNKRETPFIDSSLYTSLNGMLISAYLFAFRMLGDEAVKDFALMSLDRILKTNFTADTLYHSEGVDALLDDYVYLADALAEAYEVTGGKPYLRTAERLMELCIERFWDEGEGGFFDTPSEVAGLRLKGIEDVPHPSANSAGILLLLKLHSMSGKGIYLEYAERALKAFSSDAADLSIHAGYYFCALDAYFNMMKLEVQAAPESALARAAVSFFRPYTAVAYGEDRNRIISCVRSICSEPVTSPEGLQELMKGGASH